MGYYMNVMCKDNLKLRTNGGKLYGYLEDVEFAKLLSVKYLISEGIWDKDKVWELNIHYGCPEIELTAHQFVIFMYKYVQDKLEIKRPVSLADIEFYFDENIWKVIYSHSDKIIHWS